MPLTCTILRDRNLIRVVADGPVTLRDMEEHFDELFKAEVLSFAKLFDATKLKPVYTEHDMYMLGARLSAYAKLDNGPLAIVGTEPEVLVAIKRFLNMGSSQRPARTFPTIEAAERWLAEVRTAPQS